MTCVCICMRLRVGVTCFCSVFLLTTPTTPNQSTTCHNPPLHPPTHTHQVVAEDTTDEWSIHRPRELKPGAFGPAIYKALGHPGSVKEKNWMPFVRGDQLYMSHSVVPHRVFRINSQGVAVQQFVTNNEALFLPFAGQDVHGGPPVVLIDGPLLAQGAQPYYLGIFHFFMVRAALASVWPVVWWRVVWWRG